MGIFVAPLPNATVDMQTLPPYAQTPLQSALPDTTDPNQLPPYARAQIQSTSGDSSETWLEALQKEK